MFDRNFMINCLQQGVCKVTFMKNDGSDRVMMCSRRAKYLPVEEVLQLNQPYPRTPNLDVIAVWDLEKDDWRCFRVNSVKEFELVLHDEFDKYEKRESQSI